MFPCMMMRQNRHYSSQFITFDVIVEFGYAFYFIAKIREIESEIEKKRKNLAAQ